MALNNLDQGTNVSLTRGHQSTNDVILCLHLVDDNITNTNGTNTPTDSNGYEIVGTYKDSCFIKSRFTLFSADQIYYIKNNIYDSNPEFNYFYKFNYERGSRSNRLFSDDLQDITTFRTEILRSLNYIQQYKSACNFDFNDEMEWMMKYAIMWSSFESFSMDLCQDVKLDGYHSVAAKIICDFQIGLYRNG